MRTTALTRLLCVLTLAAIVPAAVLAVCRDDDGDGYGERGDPSCPAGPVPDCDDTNGAVYPGAPEICDGLNNDCDHPEWPSLDGWYERTIATNMDGALDVFAADIDDDGDIDVLSATHWDRKIAWHENASGDGSEWTEHVISTVPYLPHSVFAADVDGDGDMDALSASRQDATVAWYENTDGAGSFGPQQIISTTVQGTRSVFAADVDGDDDVDVLSASYELHEIRWFENEVGDGSAWTQRLVSSDAFYASDVFAADVDGDGDTDLLSASDSSSSLSVRWYENLNGDGLIWTVHVVSATVSRMDAIFTADVDGDDDLDVVAASYYNDTVAWYENVAGDGSVWTEMVISTAIDGATSVFAADLDGDADTDVLSAAYSGDQLFWFENSEGDGSFWAKHVLSNTINAPAAVLAADLDGDDDLDVASAAFEDDAFAWYEPVSIERDDDGDGLADCEGDCDDTNQFCTTDCSDADLDGFCVTTDCDEGNANCTADCTDTDGDDFCVGHDCDEAFASCTVDCSTDVDLDGTHDCADDCIDVDEDGYGAPGGAGDGGCVAADCDDAKSNCTFDCVDTDGDGYCVTHDCDDGVGSCTDDCVTNGDGDASPACADCDDADETVYVGAPEICDGVNNDCDNSTWPWLAGWIEGEISADVSGADEVYAADIDGDGDMDALSGTLYDGTIAWYENLTGDGSEWREHPLAETWANNVRNLEAADLDGDGDLDVAAAARGPLADVWWYENVLGDGALWIEHVIYAADSFSTSSIFVADVDGDDDWDVVTSTFEVYSPANHIVWHENTAGDASAWTTHVVDSVDDGARVAAADVDSDDDVDILATIAGDDLIAWYENASGDGTSWVQHPISAFEAVVLDISGSDLDGDGDPDALFANNSSQVAWYENSGDGSTWTRHVILSGEGANSVFAIDVDGDDDIDVLTANYWHDKVAWHENIVGDASIWSEHLISTNADGALSVVAADLDGDGDPEALSASFFGLNIAWYIFDAVEGDDDSDGLADCEGDCDDRNRFCDVDCTDLDSDGYCVTTDCDESNPLCGVDCTDLDGDAACSSHDCDESDSGSWLKPGEVRALVFGEDAVTLSWTEPLEIGGLAEALAYDTIRSGDASDFLSGAVCVESDDGADRQAEDSDEPGLGQVFFYLIRAENSCGVGAIGDDSDGDRRPVARMCER